MADKKFDKQLKNLKSDFGAYWHPSLGRRGESRDSVSSSDRSADVTPAPPSTSAAASPPPPPSTPTTTTQQQHQQGRATSASSSSRHRHSRSHGHGHGQGQHQHHQQHQRNNSGTDSSAKASGSAKRSDHHAHHHSRPPASPIRASGKSRRHRDSAEPSPSRREASTTATTPAPPSPAVDTPSTTTTTTTTTQQRRGRASTHDEREVTPIAADEEDTKPLRTKKEETSSDDEDDAPLAVTKTRDSRPRAATPAGKGKHHRRSGGGDDTPHANNTYLDVPTTPAPTMSSQRGRSQRGPNRNSDQGGEELALWQTIQDEIRDLVALVNTDSENARAVIAQDSFIVAQSKSKDDDDGDSKDHKKKSAVELAEEGDNVLEGILRRGVKDNEAAQEQIRSVIEKMQVLSAMQKVKEESEAGAGTSSSGGAAGGKLGGGGERGPGGRSGGGLLSGTGRTASRMGMRDRSGGGATSGGGSAEKPDREGKGGDRGDRGDRDRDRGERERERERDRDRDRDPASLYDFDAGDSPAPSPIGGHTRKLGGLGGLGGLADKGGGGPASDRSGNRDSVPPRGGDRDTPAKADSAEPQFPGGGSALQRSRVSFIKGQDVAFKPKGGPASASSGGAGGDSPDWYLGKVQQVLGEGKSRRYKVKDEDPDVPPEQRQEYRTSASSMIPIPAAGQDLPELEKGRTVLALYPDSTTFYKAEVMGADRETGKVNLRFEGEENSGTLQVVERRFVVEYRS